jgi:alpha-beta hydrolase superfamily lysophospholipase
LPINYQGTPAQLQELRDLLPPFKEAAPPAALLLDYCRYYSIDFASQRAQVKHLAGTVYSDTYSLATHLWTQPGASSNLLLLHGYMDHTGLFSKLIDYGLSRNCNVLMFDLPGHGLSSGESAVIDDFGEYSQAIDAVLSTVELPGLPLWVMAQSTGGAALMDYATKYAWPFAATVLLAPLVRPAGWFGMRIVQLLLSPIVDSVPRKFTKNSSDPDFLDFVQRDPLQSQRISVRWIGALRRWLRGLRQQDLGVGPALIIQGDADDTVDWRYNMGALAKLLPGSQVEFLDGAGHQLANESEAFRHRYFACVDAYLAAAGIELDSASGVEPSGSQ